jgi:hypothetical protein
MGQLRPGRMMPSTRPARSATAAQWPLEKGKGRAGSWGNADSRRGRGLSDMARRALSRTIACARRPTYRVETLRGRPVNPESS